MTQIGPIKPAKISWREGDAPYSSEYGDIYFSGDGEAETRHVFIAGNDLPARIQTKRVLNIGETGFGTGLNFLTLWNFWQQSEKPPDARLNFVSVEAHPLARVDFVHAHENRSGFRHRVTAVASQYPPLQAGVHRLHFKDGVSLTLLFGDALTMLTNYRAKIDAWFLDGFTPSRNPALWSPELMRELARLSAPNATFGTFTVAGAVRRALSTAGFETEKRKGFGNKREMLVGNLRERPNQSSPAPWFDGDTRAVEPDAKIAIIGAGIAGASLAFALNRRGYSPVVFDAVAPAAGASGNPAGLIMPRLDADTSPIARFNTAAYLHAVRLLERMRKDNANFFYKCGGYVIASGDHERARQEKISALRPLPPSWIKDLGDRLHFPQAGVVDPRELVRAMMNDVTFIRQRITALNRSEDKWRLICGGAVDLFDAVIIANGVDALLFSQCRTLPLSASAGQIDIFYGADAPASIGSCGGYYAPLPGDAKKGLVIGATYDNASSGPPPAASRSCTERNIEGVASFNPTLANAFNPADSRPRAGIRCVTPDQTPIVGPVPEWGFFSGAYDGLRRGRVKDYPIAKHAPGLYILTGLGSRGLVTAPLCAEIIASRISGASSPVSADIEDALNPARFFVRSLKKNRQLKARPN